jgi:flagellar protein FlaG
MSIQSITSSPAPVSSATSSAQEMAVKAQPRQAPPRLANAQFQEEEQNVQFSREDLLNAAQAANEFISHVNDNLQFSVDDDTGKTIIKVVDSTTHEVIKQIPSEEMIAIAKAMDKLKGLLIQQKA